MFSDWRNDWRNSVDKLLLFSNRRQIINICYYHYYVLENKYRIINDLVKRVAYIVYNNHNHIISKLITLPLECNSYLLFLHLRTWHSNHVFIKSSNIFTLLLEERNARKCSDSVWWRSFCSFQNKKDETNKWIESTNNRIFRLIWKTLENNTRK